MPLSPGQTLNNRYRIVKLLGQGGFGAVYRAWDSNLDCPRALKENFDTSPESQRQFRREAQILTVLTHPNLPKVVDHFVIQGQGQYLVMDYIEGQDLEEMLKNQGNPLPEAQVLGWFSQICDALIYLHSQNPPIIHRDIKPGNIKITPQGKALLVDFGIAKVYDVNSSTTMGARAVTPGYSPQEQYGQGKTDARTDVYALGATLYHLLTGKQPPESIQRNLGMALTPPRQINPALSEQTEQVVLKAMARLPERRWQSVGEMKEAFARRIVQKNRIQTAVAGQRKTSTTPKRQTAPTKKVWGWIASVIAGLIVLTIVGLGVASWISSGEEQVTDVPQALALPATLTQTTFPPTFTQTVTPTLTPTFTLIPNTPTPTNTPAIIIDARDIEMALIPAGEFLMGAPDSDKAALSNEKPQHPVYLDDFYIDVYEVTNAMYMACVDAGRCKSFNDNDYRSAGYENYPVGGPTWNMAQTYCEWRGISLPTEAQWEKAARGGLEGKLYYWGDGKPDCTLANFNDSGEAPCLRKVAVVGSYPPNGYGLYDMAGNMWEWVWDWYQENYYGSLSTWSNPTGPDTGQYRMRRGGSWNGGIDLYARITLREEHSPSDSSGDVGFRCARTP